MIPDNNEILLTMREKYYSLTGFYPDDASDIGIRFKVLAAVLEKMWQKLGDISLQAFPESAMGESLEKHAQTRGLFRKQGTKAEGMLRFSRQSPTAHDVVIPRGVLCQTYGEEGIRVITTEEGLLKSGRLYTDVAAQAVEEGHGGNLSAGTVTGMINPPIGVSSVTNPNPFYSGSSAENDAELRNRLLESYKNVSNGTNAAYYMQEAMKFSGISSAAVLPLRRGAGTVDVIVSCRGENPPHHLLEEIQQHFNNVREIGTNVLVLAAKETVIGVEIELTPAEGVRLEEISKEIQERITEYIKDLKIGQSLFSARLCSLILESNKAINCRITLPEGDRHILKDEIIRIGGISVKEMAVSQ